MPGLAFAITNGEQFQSAPDPKVGRCAIGAWLVVCCKYSFNPLPTRRSGEARNEIVLRIIDEVSIRSRPEGREMRAEAG